MTALQFMAKHTYIIRVDYDSKLKRCFFTTSDEEYVRQELKGSTYNDATSVERWCKEHFTEDIGWDKENILKEIKQ